MSRFRVVVSLAGCVLLAACSGSPGPVTGAAEANGTLTGAVRAYGGPTTPNGGQALNGQPQAGVAVYLSADGREVASATTDAQGRYTLRVAAGTYRIEGCGGTFAAAGETVAVVGGLTTQHDVTCAVP